MKKTIKKCLKYRNIKIGGVLVGLILLMMLVSLFYIPYNPNKIDAANTLAHPSLEHFLGTDENGRDIFSRIMKGSQIAFVIGTLAVAIGFFVGTIVGSIGGFFGKWIDEIFMRLVDVQMSFPGVLVALMLVAVLGYSIQNTILAIGIMSIPSFVRITRSGYLQYKNAEFVKSAKAKGASSIRIMYRHILPNIVSPLVVTATLAFSLAIIAEAALSYMGVGVQPPDPSWGTMLKDAQRFMISNPVYAIAPGVFISTLVLGFNLLGDGLRDVLDTKL